MALVAFVFGVAGTDDLPGVALTALLAEVGMGAAAARQQLARMRRDGQLRVARRGREVDYRLAGPTGVAFRRLQSATGTPTASWDGHFHAILYQVPEMQRAYRDRLRRTAQLVGYGLMQQGVLIAVQDLSDHIAEVLAETPPGCQVQQATIGFPPVDAARIAQAAWNLDAVAASLRGHVASLSTALDVDESPPPTAATLRRLVRLLNTPYFDLISNPTLPAELLPADWPASRLVTLINQVQERYLPPAHRYATAVMEAARARRLPSSS